MGRKILLAATGVGVAFAAIAMFMDFERTSNVPRDSRGMVVGTMAHLKGVKLTAVAKLPDYVVDNGDVQKAYLETASAIIMYTGTTQLDILMDNLPAD